MRDSSYFRGHRAYSSPWLMKKILLCLSVHRITSTRRPFRSPPFVTRAATSSAAPWQSETFLSKSDWNKLRRYQKQPPSIFSPGGRLHIVERFMQALEEDPSSNLVVALRCREGVVVASSVQAPANAAFFLHKNATTSTEARDNPLWLDSPLADCSSFAPWSYSSSCVVQIPFAENEHLFAITAGNAVHSQIFRQRIRKAANSLYIAEDDGIFAQVKANKKSSSVPSLARSLADELQNPTQTSQGGMMVVSRSSLFALVFVVLRLTLLVPGRALRCCWERVKGYGM